MSVSTSAAGAPVVAGVALTQVRVSPKTIWLFVQVTDAVQAVGVGEATLQREEAAVEAVLARLAPTMLGRAAEPRALADIPLQGQSCAFGAAVSALDHALWDLAGQRAQQSVAQLLGASAHAIELYANVNRGLPTRDPAAFAQAARGAVEAGFNAVKIAPFDEIDMFGRWGDAIAPTAKRLESGLARIAAARAAVGPDVELMVDCHWRFDEASAQRVIDACAAFKLYWIECPIPEERANLPALKRLRARTHQHGMLLAGGEDGVGRAAFMPFLTAGAYDVLMPDIKYVGGFAEMRAVAALAAPHGVAIAPHNPTGPVAHMASLHACAGLPQFSRLELQFNESPLFDTLVTPALPAPVQGRVAIPHRPGLGAALAGHEFARHVIRHEIWGVA
ncbi:MAG: mandelate racemase/muconate lactonizing enzyme family protein [Casimicrobiaceae bacterium]